MSTAIYDDVIDNTEDLDDLGLTDEELKAIRPEGEEEDAEEAEEEVEEAEDTAPEDTDEPEVEPAADDAVEPAATAAPSEVDTTFAPQFSAESTEGLQDQLNALSVDADAKSETLAALYENGTLSFSEYRKQDRELSAQYSAATDRLRSALLKAEIAEEHSRQSSAQKWELEQAIFFQDNAVYKTDAILKGALGAQLEQLYADEANQGRSGLWFLKEAGRLVDARFNRTPGVEKEAELDKAKDAMRKKAAKPIAVPKTLASVPAADTNDDSGEFTYLDKLGGLAYEKALTKLSPEQYERYMAE